MPLLLLLMLPVKILRMIVLMMRLPVLGADAVEMILTSLKLMYPLSVATNHPQLMILLLLAILILLITKILLPQPQYSSQSFRMH